MGGERESEARFRVLADSVPVLIWATGTDGGATFFNRRWLEFTGRTLEQELGAGWAEDLHPDDMASCVRLYQQAFERRQRFEMEYRLRRADGEWRWVLVRGVPLAGPGGDFGGYVGTCIDITERRLAEEALRASRQDLAEVMAAGRMGTFDWDVQTGRVTRDPNLQSLYGLDPGQAGSFDEWLAIVHPDDRAAVSAEVDRVLHEGGEYRLTHRVVRRDGEVRWVERRGEAFAGESGRVARIRGIVIDVTDREAAAQERDVLLERVTRLQAVTAALSKAGTTSEVLEVIAGDGLDAMGASAGSVAVLSGAGDGLEVIRADGYPPAVLDRFRWIPLDSRLPLADAVHTGTTVLCRDRRERSALYPHLLDQTLTGYEAFAAYPLVVEDRVLGAMGLSFLGPQPFDPAQVAFLDAVAAQCAQALDRARSYEAVRLAHAEAERSAAQLRFLLDVSTLLAAPIDPEDRLGELAARTAGTLCDLCLVDLVDADGAVRRVAAAHADPVHQPLADDYRSRFPLGADSALPAATVIRTGKADICPEVTDEWLRAAIANPSQFAAAKQLMPVSSIAVPLLGRRRVLGALTLISTARSGRRYTLDDLALAEDMAGRVAQAIDSARLSEEMRRVAQTLQASLLPTVPPAIPGLEVATRYLAAGEGTMVGGDFYDVFATGPGAWAAVVGDVCGQGVGAATITGVARHTVRSAALEHRSPAAVLAHLNEVLRRMLADSEGEADPRFATVCLARVEVAADRATVTVALGGHPPPILVPVAGAPSTVGEPGTVLGVLAGAEVADRQFVLGAGDALVLYTDGVTERRAGGRYLGEDGLMAVLDGAAGFGAEGIAARVEEAVRSFDPQPPTDDMALLVLRLPSG